MWKCRLSISYTFVTLIEGRWRNLLSLLDFWAFEVSFESSSARFFCVCARFFVFAHVFCALWACFLRGGNADKWAFPPFFFWYVRPSGVYHQDSDVSRRDAKYKVFISAGYPSFLFNSLICLKYSLALHPSLPVRLCAREIKSKKEAIDTKTPSGKFKGVGAMHELGLKPSTFHRRVRAYEGRTNE